jgi:hypothetical protein
LQVPLLLKIFLSTLSLLQQGPFSTFCHQRLWIQAFSPRVGHHQTSVGGRGWRQRQEWKPRPGS